MHQRKIRNLMLVCAAGIIGAPGAAAWSAAPQEQLRDGSRGAGPHTTEVQPTGPCVVPVGGYTTAHCWRCFRSLLSECSGLSTPQERQACMDAANTFYEWCLNQVPPVVADPQPHPGVGNHLLDVRSDFVINMDLDGDRFVTDVRIMVLDSLTWDWVEIEAEFLAVAGGDEGPMLYEIVIPAGAADLDGRPPLNVHVELLEGDETVFATAFRPEFTDSFDLNNDGVFDERDRIKAMELYVDHVISLDEMIQIISH